MQKALVRMNHLKRAFRQNRYSNLDIKHALVPKQRPHIQQEKLAGNR
jgi:hypothetical protein